MPLSNLQIKSITRDYRKALKYPALYLFMFLLALNMEVDMEITADTECMSILWFICVFSDSWENKRYLHKVMKTRRES